MIERFFQYTNINANNNKYWNVRFEGGKMTVHYGRVGSTGSKKEFIVSEYEMNKKIAEKISKGYREIVMATAATTTIQQNTYHPVVQKIVADLLATANIQMASTLLIALDALSLSQINQARKLLDVMASSGKTKHGVNNYYNLIPTKLPYKIDAAKLVTDFNLADEYDRLNQFEVKLQSVQTQKVTGRTQFDELAERMTFVEVDSPEWKAIIKDVNQGSVHGYKIKVKHIVAITIPNERAAFEANKFGAHKTMRLWHGGRTANAAHILMSGLRIMPTAANGSMFGRGIYLASECSKSANYCNTSNDKLSYLYLTDAHVGDCWVAPQGDQSITKAPNGYHSVWGKKGYTQAWGGALRNHEYIVYNENQVTIKYLIAYEQA